MTDIKQPGLSLYEEEPDVTTLIRQAREALIMQQVTPTTILFAVKALDKTAQWIGNYKLSIADYERSFDLRWNAGQRAIKRWQEAHPGQDHVWPDHSDLCLWLMDQLACREQEISGGDGNKGGLNGSA